MNKDDLNEATKDLMRRNLESVRQSMVFYIYFDIVFNRVLIVHRENF
jgi:hypothetical protein